MADITAAEIKKLRDMTGAGFIDCKKALTEADGDLDKAVEILRVKGAAKAAKRGEERDASNGLVVAGAGRDDVKPERGQVAADEPLPDWERELLTTGSGEASGEKATAEAEPAPVGAADVAPAEAVAEAADETPVVSV